LCLESNHANDTYNPHNSNDPHNTDHANDPHNTDHADHTNYTHNWRRSRVNDGHARRESCG
jgi:hypothetical protein